MSLFWADRLERKIGFISIPGLAALLTGLNAAVALLTLFRPEFPEQLNLDPLLLRQGQIWRVATYVIVPPQTSPLWLFLWIILFYFYAQMLERTWGDFKFTLFCLVGAAGTVIASLVLNQELTNSAFNTSLFLAFARLNPEFQILLFFFVPVKMKWLAAVTWALTGMSFLLGDISTKIALTLGFMNYFLFFGTGHWQELKLRWHHYRRSGRY